MAIVITAARGGDWPYPIQQRAESHIAEDPPAQPSYPFPATAPRTCLSCGAKTDQQGVLPCGH